jgi:uncharacterized protein YdeI (YjbR/CyaY-like superfamily)
VRGTINGAPLRSDWIKEAKREDTRRRRIAKAVELIRQGRPHR